MKKKLGKIAALIKARGIEQVHKGFFIPEMIAKDILSKNIMRRKMGFAALVSVIEAQGGKVRIKKAFTMPSWML